MKVAFTVSTPHQVHVYRNASRILQEEGHETLFLVRDYGITLPLVKHYGLPHLVINRDRLGLAGKALEHVEALRGAVKALRAFRPDVVMGDSLMGHAASLLRVPSIGFADGDQSGLYNFAYRRIYTVDLLCTPRRFRVDAGKKHLRYPGFQELAYLDPARFRPDPSIRKDLGVAPGERYALLRFSAFDSATHDTGRRGLDVEQKRRLVAEVSRRAKVVISSETGLPDDLKPHAMRFPPHRMHDALAFADLLFAETAMVSEAAILGTPAVFVHPDAGPGMPSNFLELERLGLLRSFNDPEAAIAEALRMLDEPGEKKEREARRDEMLDACVDVTAMIVWLAKEWGAGRRRRAKDVDLSPFMRKTTTARGP